MARHGPLNNIQQRPLPHVCLPLKTCKFNYTLLLKKCFFSFVFVSHSYYKVFSLQCLLFALAYWNVVFLKLHFKVWLSFLLQANGACFMNLIWSRHHFLMLKIMVKQKSTLVDQSNVPNIWFQWVDNLLMFGLSLEPKLLFWPLLLITFSIQWYPHQDSYSGFY